MPTLRGRLANRFVRMVVKHWPVENPVALVRRARRIFGQPAFMRSVGLGPVTIEAVSNGVRGEWLRPKETAAESAIFYLHGGGYVSCSPQSHRPITAALARLTRRAVFALDYRLAPEHPFPAALDDAFAAYRWLLKNGVRPEKIAIGGDSAGGGLSVATMLRARDQGVPLAGCAFLLSPWVDLAGKGDYRNSECCAMFEPKDGRAFALQYLGGASPEDPRASPLYANLKGLPPLLIQASDTELLFEDAVRLHEKAVRSGVTCSLRTYPGMPHVWQMFARLVPEAKAALAEIAEFIGEST